MSKQVYRVKLFEPEYDVDVIKIVEGDTIRKLTVTRAHLRFAERRVNECIVNY